MASVSLPSQRFVRLFLALTSPRCAGSCSASRTAVGSDRTVAWFALPLSIRRGRVERLIDHPDRRAAESLRPEEVLSRIVASVREHQGSGELGDDATALVVRWDPTVRAGSSTGLNASPDGSPVASRSDGVPQRNENDDWFHSRRRNRHICVVEDVAAPTNPARRSYWGHGASHRKRREGFNRRRFVGRQCGEGDGCCERTGGRCDR